MSDLIAGVKGLLNVVNTIDNVDLLQKMMVVQNEAYELDTENRELKDRVRELEERLELRGKVIFEQNMYWLPGENDSRDGPYCPKCYGTDGCLRRLSKHPSFFACPVCQMGIEPDGGVIHSRERSVIASTYGLKK